MRLRLAVQAARQPDALIENRSEDIGYYATPDQAERAQVWADPVAIQLEEAPYVCVGNIPVIGAARKRVQDITLTPSSGWLLTRTWVNDA